MVSMATQRADTHRFLIQIATILALGALCVSLSIATAGCIDQLFAGSDDDGTSPPVPDAGVPGRDLCEACLLPEDCGGSRDVCLANFGTHERFCGQDCSAVGCPAGFQCVSMGGDGSTAPQCVPETETCGLASAGCDPGCDAADGLTCRNGRCYRAGDYLAERALCVELVNAYRARLDQPPLLPDPELEDCARESAEVDGETEVMLGHYEATGGCGFVANGETEIPGWALSTFGTVDAVVDYGIGTLWNEGPGSANYETLAYDYEVMGCGVYVTPANRVWLVLTFR